MQSPHIITLVNILARDCLRNSSRLSVWPSATGSNVQYEDGKKIFLFVSIKRVGSSAPALSRPMRPQGLDFKNAAPTKTTALRTDAITVESVFASSCEWKDIESQTWIPVSGKNIYASKPDMDDLVRQRDLT